MAEFSDQYVGGAVHQNSGLDPVSTAFSEKLRCNLIYLKGGVIFVSKDFHAMTEITHEETLYTSENFYVNNSKHIY